MIIKKNSLTGQCLFFVRAQNVDPDVAQMILIMQRPHHRIPEVRISQDDEGSKEYKNL